SSTTARATPRRRSRPSTRAPTPASASCVKCRLGWWPRPSARAEAQAPLIARMDADDVALPERPPLQGAALEEGGVAGVGGRVEYFPEPTDGMRAYAGWLNSLVTVEAAVRDLWVECPVPGPGLTARAELVSYRDEGWPEDYDLVLRIWEGGGRFRNVDRLVHRWRDHPGRLPRTRSEYTLPLIARAHA